MEEDFLHYIWKFGLFEKAGLKTTRGETIQILNPGTHNTDSGPDFFNGRIRIGKTVWAGNIEMHARASDWHKHHHGQDPAYGNVILHVVYDSDMHIVLPGGNEIPQLELGTAFPKNIYDQYKGYVTSKSRIPCHKNLKKVSPTRLSGWLDRLMAERLEKKSLPIIEHLQRTKNNWNASFFRALSSGMGMKVNAQAFEMLADSIPYTVITKNVHDRKRLEALLYGQAGFLESGESYLIKTIEKENYFLTLKEEYIHLKKKYHLKPMRIQAWKFMRLHPPSFPTIRISQLAGLLYTRAGIFSKMIEANDVQEIASLFNVSAHPYWNNHYRFNKSAPKVKTRQIGDSLIRHLLINVLAPFLFIYGKEKDRFEFRERALALLEYLKPEENNILRLWKKAGVRPLNASESQALIQLYNNYCTPRKCLECHLGSEFIR